MDLACFFGGLSKDPRLSPGLRYLGYLSVQAEADDKDLKIEFQIEILHQDKDHPVIVASCSYPPSGKELVL